MLCNIIALGESASKWDGSGDSIGVNDAYRWGHKLQLLLLLNTPREFNSEEFEFIKKTNADFTYSCIADWQRIIPDLIPFHYSVWQQKLSKKITNIQTSLTSPFCAISLAYNLGYDEIILWGVDFKTHPVWNAKNSNYHREINNYKQLIKQLADKGVKVYHCEEKNILGLPVYEKAIA